MTILPKNKQPKSSGSSLSGNNNGSSNSGASTSVSSSASAVDPSVPNSSGVIGPVVVGLPVPLTGSKRSREVASSVEPGGGSGSNDVGPSSSKRRHHRDENSSRSVAGDPVRGSDRSSHRHHHNPYLHLAKKVSGKSLCSASSSADIDSIVGRSSPSALSVVGPAVNPGSCNDSNNVINSSPIVVAASPLDLNGTNTSNDLSNSIGVLSVGEGSNGGSNVQVSLSPPGSPAGYNSGDEYATNENRDSQSNVWTPEEQIEMERRFEKKLRKKGFLIAKMGEDGACLFRAVADQVYGDQEMHELVRKLCCDYMVSFYSERTVSRILTKCSRRLKTRTTFLNTLLKTSTHMSPERDMAISRVIMSSCKLSVKYSPDQSRFIITTRSLSTYSNRAKMMRYHFLVCKSEYSLLFKNQIAMGANDEPIRLSYHSSGLVDSGHYNSVRSARVSFKPKATLIHYTPPQVLETAIRSSESDALEKAMLEDKLRASDWEATNEALEEQVARESYLEWVRENEQRKRKGNSGNSSPTGSSVVPRDTALSSSTITKSPSQEGGNSPKAGGSGSYSDWNESVLRPNRSPSHKTSAYTSVDDDVAAIAAGSSFLQRSDTETEREILARVLLESRREYLENLKAKKQKEHQNQSMRRSKSPNFHSHRTTRSSSRSSSPSTSSSCYNIKETTPPPSSSRS